jgi:hypothetical protein
MKGNVRLLNAFRKRNKITIEELTAAARVISALHPKKRHFVPARDMWDLYKRFTSKHGETCSQCKLSPPDVGVTLMIATKSRKKFLNKKPKMSEIQLLCKKDAKLFFQPKTKAN